MTNSRHSYATDFGQKPGLYVLLFIISGVLASGLGLVLQHLNAWLGIAAPSFSALALFGGLFWLFDKYLWRWRWVRGLLLVPDLNGVWTVNGETQFKNQEKPSFDAKWQGEVRVEQTWTKLIIKLSLGKSASTSTCAAIVDRGNNDYSLVYLYENRPGQGRDDDMKRHDGAVLLDITDDAKVVKGKYFTDQDRSTEGFMEWHRASTSNG